ncbi:hypothetical protein CRUP_014565, partial [Coryphaenoides rupestris]
LYKEIEICSKITKVIRFDRDESCMIGYGFSISVVEEDGVQQLYITDVKAGGLAFAKGLNAGDEILQLNSKDAHSLNFSDMKAAFTRASLSLTVNTAAAHGPPAALLPAAAPLARPGRPLHRHLLQSQ